MNSFFIRQNLFYESLYFLIDHLRKIPFEAIRLRKKVAFVIKKINNHTMALTTGHLSCPSVTTEEYTLKGQVKQ